MTPSLDNVDRIQRVAQALASRSVVADDDALWLAGGLLRFLEGEDFEVAIGLPLAGTPWRLRAAQAKRNELLGELAARQFPDGSARAIASALKRYATTSWPRERSLAAPRPATVGTSAELLWKIFQIGNVPESAKQIGRILRTQSQASNVRPPMLLSPSNSEVQDELAIEKRDGRRHRSPA